MLELREWDLLAVLSSMSMSKPPPSPAFEDSTHSSSPVGLLAECRRLSRLRTAFQRWRLDASRQTRLMSEPSRLRQGDAVSVTLHPLADRR